MRRLLTSDPNAQKKVWMDFSDPSVEFTIVTEYETSHILDANKAKANEYRKGSLVGNTQKHYQHIAEIPNDIMAKLTAKFGSHRDNPKAWKRWLNDIDNMHWRTGGGNV